MYRVFMKLLKKSSDRKEFPEFENPDTWVPTVQLQISSPGRTPFAKFFKRDADSETDSCDSEPREEIVEIETPDSPQVKASEVFDPTSFENIPVITTPKRYVPGRYFPKCFGKTKRRIDFDQPEDIELEELKYVSNHKNTTLKL